MRQKNKISRIEPTKFRCRVTHSILFDRSKVFKHWQQIRCARNVPVPHPPPPHLKFFHILPILLTTFLFKASVHDAELKLLLPVTGTKNCREIAK